MSRLKQMGISSKLTWASFAVALIALTGSLWLSMVMDLKACPLCFYQRTFVMSAVAVLGIGLFAGIGPATSLSLLALPLAVGGLGVSLFHVSLEMRNKLECPAGVLGIGTAPQQALAVLAVLFALLLAAAVTGRRPEALRWPALLSGILVGGMLAFASIRSAPPPPPTPTQPYDQPLQVCRPPFNPG